MMGNRTHEPSSTTEDPDRYAENGLHPVLIDDELKGGRYRVVHKLGAGSFSTVWLARDNEKDKYVSLKILAAERPIDTKELAILKDIASSTLNHPGRQFVVCLTDEFVIEGPNGKHVCLVTEVAGQRLSKTQSADESSLKQSRSIGFQLAQALGFLDDLKIVHADCYTSNILSRLKSFDDWCDAQVYEALGQPVKHQIRRLDGSSLSTNVPSYTVESGDVTALQDLLATGEILLIDFGESFYHHEIPKEIVTPAPFAAPEIVFGTQITPAIDRWAFGCIVYELAADHTLFKMIFGWFNDTLKDQVSMLGKPPDAMWRNWEGREKYFHPDGTPKEAEGRRLKVERYPLEQRVRNIGLPLSERNYGASSGEKLSGELRSLYDLLKGIMVYDAASRIPFREIQGHPFLSYSGTTSL